MKVRGENRFVQYVGVFAASLFVAASAIYLYSPTFSSSAAETIDVGIDVSSILSMSVSDETPSGSAPAGGGFTALSTDASVTTNSRFGWSLSLEDADNNTSMTSETSDDTITSDFYSYKTSETFNDNTWGFSVGEGKYYAIPEYGSPVKIASSNAPADSAAITTLSFGIQVGTYLTSGHYADQVLLTAYANGVDGEPGDGTYLDEMSDENLMGTMQGFRCSSLANVGDGVALMDIRDEKIYNVKKLADGKCWMVSNLAIENKVLTSQYSDLARGATFTVPATDNANWNWHVEVDANKMVLETNSIRYGGYYSWYTATAGEGTYSVVNQNVEHSICPKNWKLPTGGSNSEGQALVNAYGSSASRLGEAPNLNSYDRGFLDEGGNHLPKIYAGWTSTALQSGNAYSIYVYPNTREANATKTYDKGYGLTVRCVARK